MQTFTIDELYDLTDAIRNQIQDNADYCRTEDNFAQTQARLEVLFAKVCSQIEVQSNLAA